MALNGLPSNPNTPCSLLEDIVGPHLDMVLLAMVMHLLILNTKSPRDHTFPMKE